MRKPEFLGVEAAACVANPASAVSILGAGLAEEVIAAAVVCNLPAMGPLLGAASVIA